MKGIKIILTLIFFISGFSGQIFAQTVIVEEEAERAEAKALREAERARSAARTKAFTLYAPHARHTSELSFSKSFDQESLDSEKSFIINKESQSVTLSLSGEVMEGTIKLTLLSPDGDEYQVLEIDNSSDLLWRQSFSLDEKTDENLIGKWKIKIKAEGATGSYMFRMISL